MRRLFIILFALFGAYPASRAAEWTEVQGLEVQQAFMEKNYPRVIALIGDRELRLEEDHDLLFLRAVSHAETGDPARARADLDRYLRRHGFYTVEAREMQQQLREAADGWTTRLLLQTGVVYDSRVVSFTDRPPFFEDDDDTAVRLRLALDFEHDRGVIGRYRGYGLNYFDQGEDRHEHAVEAGLSRNLFNGTLEWVGLGEVSFEGSSRDFSRLGTRAEMAWLAGEESVFWLGLEVGDDSFPDAKEFEGAYTLASTGLEQYLGSLALFYDGYLLWHDAEIDPLAYLEYGGGVVSAKQVTDSVGVGLSGRVTWTDFDSFDPLFEITREDTAWTLRAWLSFQISETVSLVPSFEYTTNNSNLESADYDEQLFSVDLIWTP